MLQWVRRHEPGLIATFRTQLILGQMTLTHFFNLRQMTLSVLFVCNNSTKRT